MDATVGKMLTPAELHWRLCLYNIAGLPKNNYGKML